MDAIGQAIFLLILVLAAVISSGGFFLLVRALWPSFAKRTEERWTKQPRLCVLVGVPLGAVGAAVSLLLLQIPLGGVKLLGVILAWSVLGLALVGLSGLAARVGSSLGSRFDGDRAWLRVLFGGAVLELSFLVPVIGWFVILPLTLLGSLGAAALALVPTWLREPSGAFAEPTATTGRVQ